MPGKAYQQAPSKAEKTQKTQKKADVREKLQQLPQAAGIAVMVVLLVVSLFVGNFRALQSAAPKDFLRQGDVRSIIDDRISAAKNVLTVAGRAELDANAMNAVEEAIGEMEAAKSAREISRANQKLDAAVSALTTQELSGEEARNMLSAADGFAEQGSFLRQEAREYNKQAERAEELYEKLPTKFVLPEPDVYEGI